MKKNIKALIVLLVPFFICHSEARALVGVNITPGSWNVGSGGAGTWISPSTFTMENTGTDAVKAKIRASNTQNWVLADSPALNTYAMSWEIPPNAGNISTTNTSFVSSLAVGSKIAFNLRFKSPTAINPVTMTDVQYSSITIVVEPLPIITTTYALVKTISSSIANPKGVTTDSDGNIYVSASGDNWVSKFSPSGDPIASWAIPNPYGRPILEGIAFSKDGYLYLASNTGAIRKISTAGNIVLTGGTSSGAQALVVDDVNELVYAANPLNNWVETLTKSTLVRLPIWSGFSNPYAVAVDPNTGDVYIGETCTIKKYTKDHTLLSSFGSCGSGYPPNGKLGQVGALAVDKYGYVYSGDKTNSYIHKFDTDGNFIAEWRVSGLYSNISGIHVNSSGYVYATFYDNSLLQIYEPR